MTSKYEEIEGHLGAILGSVVVILRKAGYTPQEIHEWIDLTFKAQELAPEDYRTVEIGNILADICMDLGVNPEKL
jgi:hypothetical protein